MILFAAEILYYYFNSKMLVITVNLDGQPLWVYLSCNFVYTKSVKVYTSMAASDKKNNWFSVTVTAL